MAKCPLFIAAGKENTECIREQCAWFKVKPPQSNTVHGRNPGVQGECAIKTLAINSGKRPVGR